MQSKFDSFMEAWVNVGIGFIINFTANVVLLPLFLGVPVNYALFGLLGVAYTVVSVARSYFIRRWFNGLSVWEAIKGRYQARLN